MANSKMMIEKIPIEIPLRWGQNGSVNEYSFILPKKCDKFTLGITHTIDDRWNIYIVIYKVCDWNGSNFQTNCEG